MKFKLTWLLAMNTRSKSKNVDITIFTAFILQLDKNFKANDQLKKDKQVIL